MAARQRAPAAARRWPVWICAPCRSAAYARPPAKRPMCICALRLYSSPPTKRSLATSSFTAARAEHGHVGVDAVGHQALGAALQRFQVRRARRQLQLAVAREVAVDGLVAHDARHRVDRGVVGVVPGAGPLHADLGRDLGVVDRQPVVDVPAVAARGLGGDALAGLQHHHAARRAWRAPAPPTAREAAADHRHVHLRRQLGAPAAEGRYAGGPVGRRASWRRPRCQAGQRPTTPGSPPMSVIST